MSWVEVLRDADAHHGVTSIERALELGVSKATFYRRTRGADGWGAPHPGVRTVPGAGGVKTLLAAATTASPRAAVAGRSAAWLRDLRSYPPRVQELVVPHGARRPEVRGIAVRTLRWLLPSDIDTVEGLPTLAPAAFLIDGCRWPERDLRATVIDLLHRGEVELSEIEDRLARVGPREGRGRLRRVVEGLAHRRVESIFHDEVLDELDRRGYRPARDVTPIETPDGRGLQVDIALPWAVAVEPEGDGFHRTRQQRRNDRRRTAQYAGTAWVPVPVDWRDWQLEPERVLAAIDAAVLAQHRAGHGRDHPLPDHLALRLQREPEARGSGTDLNSPR